jgi:hypothetical protein
MPTARSRPISRVDAGGLGLLELSPGLDLHVRIGGQGAGDGIVHGAAAVGLQEDRPAAHADAVSRTCRSSQTARDSKCCSRCGPRCPTASAIVQQL